MNLPLPEFKQTETGTGTATVRVTLRNNVKQRRFWIDTDVTRVLGESLSRNLSDDERSVLNFVVVNGQINVSQCQRQVKSMARWHTAKKLLMKMVAKGLLEYHKESDVDRSPTFFTLPSGAPLPEVKNGSALLPVISSGGVTEAMNFQPGVTPSSWISIFGRNLSPTTRDWTGTPDLGQNKLPFSLDGVSVTINGKPAAVFFVSPGQVNVLSSADIGSGSVSVIVRNANGQSAPATIRGTPALPAFYAPFADSSGNLFVTAVAANGDLVGKVGLDPRVKRALRPGEAVLLFGTGFGDTNPAAPTDSVFSSAYPLRALPTIRFGNATASVAFGGIVSPGLYQFNLTVPAVPDGDVPITAEIGAIQSSSKVLVSIKK